MRFLPTDLIGIELAKEVNCLRHLFKLAFTSGIARYTDADIDVRYGGEWWFSRGIEFDAAKYSLSSKVDSIQFSIDNVERELSGIIMSEETRGKECTIYRVALDKNMQVIGEAVILFLGYLDAIEIDNQRARFEVYNHFIRWKMMTPRRFHQATCMWTFKSTYCGYSDGETWCDHSWERCVALGRKLNFGGFRWLPSLIGKQIWWGRSPK